MGGNWYENSVPAHLYPQSGASPGQNMWGGQTWRAPAYNGGLEAKRPPLPLPLTSSKSGVDMFTAQNSLHP